MCARLAVRAEVSLVSEREAIDFRSIDNFRAPSGDFERVSVTVPIRRHTYALRAPGDSMVSATGDSFPAGSLLVVEPELEAQPGDYVIAHTPGGEITFKQLVRDGAELQLRPLNPRYPQKPLGDSVVIGVVRELTKRFR